MVDKPLNNVEYVVAVTSVFAVVLSFTMALFLTIQCPLADLRHSGNIPQTEIDASSMVEILAKLVPDTEAIAREVKRITEVLKINVLKTAMKNKNPKSVITSVTNLQIEPLVKILSKIVYDTEAKLEEIKKIYDILRMNVLAETSMKKKNLQSANSSETNLDVESSMVKILSQIISEAEEKSEELKKISNVLSMNVLDTVMKAEKFDNKESEETNAEIDSSMVKILSKIVSDTETKSAEFKKISEDLMINVLEKIFKKMQSKTEPISLANRAASQDTQPTIENCVAARYVLIAFISVNVIINIIFIILLSISKWFKSNPKQIYKLLPKETTFLLKNNLRLPVVE